MTNLIIDFGKHKQGSQPTIPFTWPLNTGVTPSDLTGFTLTATSMNIHTEAVANISGTFAVTDGAARTCTWALSAADSGTAGTYKITVKATDGSDTIYTLFGDLVIEENPSVTGTQNSPLVSVSVDEAAWLTIADATVTDPSDLETQTGAQTKAAAAQAAAEATSMPVINASAYGAIDNNSTDNASAIQTAITAAQGKHLHFPYTDTGIYLITTKQNGDYYFNVTGSIMITADPGVELKISNGVSDYEGIFSSSDGSDKVIIVRDFQINQNAANNSRNPASANNSRSAFQLNASYNDFGQVCVFDNVNIIGHNGVYAISAAHYNHVSITNCCILDTNANTTAQADTSAMYLYGNHITVMGNTVSASSSATYQPVSAIETHGGIQAIQGNTISRYRTAVTGTAIAPDDTKNSSIAISGNVCREMGDAISIWNASYATGGTTALPIDNCDISSNTITLSDTLHGSSTDLTGVKINNITSTFYIKNLSINNNIITTLESNLTAAAQHEALIRIQPSVDIRIDSISIQDNTLVNAPSYAIELLMTSASICTSYKIDNNIILEPMQSTAVSSTIRTAVYLNGGNNLKTGSFSNNTIHDSRSSNQIYAGAYVQQGGTVVVNTVDNNLSYNTNPTTGYRMMNPSSTTSAGNCLLIHTCNLADLPATGTENNPSVYGRPGSIISDNGAGGQYTQNTQVFNYLGSAFKCIGTTSTTSDWKLVYGDNFRRQIPYNPRTTSPFLFPRFVGEIILDTNANKFMIAFGTSQTNWDLIS